LTLSCRFGIVECLRKRHYKETMGQVGKLVPVEIPGKQVFLQKKLYLLRMSDGSSVTKHLNAFNTVIS
jgi:hypothetical protein